MYSNRIYSIFVGGIEVNDFYVSLQKANRVAMYWLKKGYNDVKIVKNKLKKGK